MHQYTVLVEDKYCEKFENFLANLNIVNSKKVVSISDKKQVVAIPKEQGK